MPHHATKPIHANNSINKHSTCKFCKIHQQHNPKHVLSPSEWFMCKFLPHFWNLLPIYIDAVLAKLSSPANNLWKQTQYGLIWSFLDLGIPKPKLISVNTANLMNQWCMFFVGDNFESWNTLNNCIGYVNKIPYPLFKTIILQLKFRNILITNFTLKLFQQQEFSDDKNVLETLLYNEHKGKIYFTCSYYILHIKRSFQII